MTPDELARLAREREEKILAEQAKVEAERVQKLRRNCREAFDTLLKLEEALEVFDGGVVRISSKLLHGTNADLARDIAKVAKLASLTHEALSDVTEQLLPYARLDPVTAVSVERDRFGRSVPPTPNEE